MTQENKPPKKDRMAREFWVKPNWSIDDLDDKRVQFELTDPKITVSGVGVFRIGQRPTGEQHIEIVVTTAPSYWELRDHIFTLRQRHADQIRKHPDQSIAEFQLIA